MHTKTTTYNGRLCNQIIRNVSVSLIAKKHNLFVEYCNHELIENGLGIPLFVGCNKYDEMSKLNDGNFFDILNQEAIHQNLDPMDNYFQTKEISCFLYEYLQTIQLSIINHNNFKERYNNNNDIFIHVRLGDTINLNPGIDYYIEAINNINKEDGTNIYIASDTLSHPMIKELCSRCQNVKLINFNPVETIQFGSTCKHVILSHGSFSAFIGWISFFSDVYYPNYKRAGKIWFGDMFSIDKWYEI